LEEAADILGLPVPQVSKKLWEKYVQAQEMRVGLGIGVGDSKFAEAGVQTDEMELIGRPQRSRLSGGSVDSFQSAKEGFPLKIEMAGSRSPSGGIPVSNTIADLRRFISNASQEPIVATVLDALDSALVAEESFERQKTHLQSVARRQSKTIEGLLRDKEEMSLEVGRLMGLVELLTRDRNLLVEEMEAEEQAREQEQRRATTDKGRRRRNKAPNEAKAKAKAKCAEVGDASVAVVGDEGESLSVPETLTVWGAGGNAGAQGRPSTASSLAPFPGSFPKSS